MKNKTSYKKPIEMKAKNDLALADMIRRLDDNLKLNRPVLSYLILKELEGYIYDQY